MAVGEHEVRVRLVILGGPKVGKSCLLRKFLFNTFPDRYRPTVEDMFYKEFHLEDITLKVDFLDTAGDNQFPAMRRLSIAGGQAFLLVYAIDDPKSFETLKQCFEEIRENKADFQDLPIVVCGNKSDMPDLRREVSKQDVSEWLYCDLPRLKTKLVECSARDGNNVREVFRSFIPLFGIQLKKSNESDATTPQLRRRSSVHLPKRLSSPREPPPSSTGSINLPTEPPSALQNCAVLKSKPRSRSLIRRTSKKNKVKTDEDCTVS